MNDLAVILWTSNQEGIAATDCMNINLRYTKGSYFETPSCNHNVKTRTKDRIMDKQDVLSWLALVLLVAAIMGFVYVVWWLMI